jgi:hypothetical protein
MNSNFSLVAGIQSMVALLRNNKTANNVDVELYLKDFDKLMFKLNRADVTGLTISTVNYHQKEIQKIVGAFTTSSHADYSVCCEYSEYIMWAQAFAEYAQYAIVLISENAGNDVLGDAKEKLIDQRQKLQDCAQLVKDENIVDFYSNAEESLRERINDYETICDFDHVQA